MTMSPGTSPPPVPLSGSLLVAVTVSDARPETASVAVTVATCTSWCLGGDNVHPAAGIPRIIGFVLSIWTAKDLEVSELPALSVAEYSTVVIPSAVIDTEDGLPPLTTGAVWAPLNEYRMACTPEPPALSVALSVTVVLVLFQPA